MLNFQKNCSSMFKEPSRRTFIKKSGATLTGLTMLGWPAVLPETNERLPDTPSIQEVIDLIIRSCVSQPLTETVDTVKIGDPLQPCRGIITTFLATVDVIRQAASRGANLIITHEPTFYYHFDTTDWLEHDPVYQYKRDLLAEHRIVVWRFHDYWHRHQPDGILHGFLQTVGWLPYLTIENRCTIPETSLRELTAFFQGQLPSQRTFFVGKGDMRFRKVALLLGAWGRQPHIEALRRSDVEVLIIGETNEWETSEYVRDAAAAGMKKGLIVLGHAASEEPGMKYLATWLKDRAPGISVAHIPSGDVFQSI